jgi:hypothetical protein
VALRRFAAVSFIEQKLREGFGLVEAIRVAALPQLSLLGANFAYFSGSSAREAA